MMCIGVDVDDLPFPTLRGRGRGREGHQDSTGTIRVNTIRIDTTPSRQVKGTRTDVGEREGNEVSVDTNDPACS